MNLPLRLILVLLSAAFCTKGADTLSRKSFDKALLNWELYFVKKPADSYTTVPAVHNKTAAWKGDSLGFHGVCWLRKEFYADSAVADQFVTIRLDITGAADVFVNRRLVKRIGIPGVSEESEQIVDSRNEYVNVRLRPGQLNEILIRYTNFIANRSFDVNGELSAGFTLWVNQNEAFLEQMEEKILLGSGAFMLLSFFGSLFFVHLVIYLFNRSEKANLYYSLFCLGTTCFILSLVLNFYTKNQAILSFANLVAVMMPLCSVLCLPFTMRTLFRLDPIRWYKALPLAALINLVLFFIFPYEAFFIMIAITVFLTAETFRTILVAVRKRKRGYKMIGAGVLFFALMIGILCFAIVFGGFVLKNPVAIFILFSILILSIFSIPVSITAYLAQSIAITNRSLFKKLEEVKELSAKTIEQEKEKQHILENQKAVLEHQVAERTAEITEQKKVIEEKNKDIIDSITYAKRIQSAMLPDEEAFKSVFEHSFVLYLPRDIVSGDFYLVSQTSSGRLLVAADCTGHGVPGALMSMVGANIIQKLVNEDKITDPARLIETLHAELRHALKQDQSGSMNRDGMDVAVVHVCEKELYFAGANRPMLWFDKENKLQELKPSKTPVGGSHIQSIHIETQVLSRDQVSRFYLFSDGFADQFGGKDGKKLMVSRFKSWLQEICHLTSSQQLYELASRFHNWKQDSEQVDDVLLIGISLTPESSSGGAATVS